MPEGIGLVNAFLYFISLHVQSFKYCPLVIALQASQYNCALSFILFTHNESVE